MHSFAFVEKVVSQRQDVELLHRWANTKTRFRLLAVSQQLREDLLAVSASSISLSGSHAVELTGGQAEEMIGVRVGGGEKRSQQLPSVRKFKDTHALTATREARKMIAEANFIFVSGWEDVVEEKGRCKENDDSGGPEKEDTSTPQRLFATSCPPATLTHLPLSPTWSSVRFFPRGRGS